MFHRGEGRGWTAEEWGERTIEAFAQLYGRAVIAGHGTFRDSRSDAPITAASFIAAIRGGLPDREYEALCAWAKSKAGLSDTLSEVCRVRGWNRSSIEEWRRHACARLADKYARVSA